MTRFRTVAIAFVSILVSVAACAAGGGGGMAGVVVADDGSLLVPVRGGGTMGNGGMDGGGGMEGEPETALVNLRADGGVRWTAELAGMATHPVTQGDLVLFELAAGMGSGDPMGGGDAEPASALVALDLATGTERFRRELDGRAMSIVFAADGARIYIEVAEMGDRGGQGSGGGNGHGNGGGNGGGNGDGCGGSRAILALDRAGTLLWSWAPEATARQAAASASR